MTWSPVVVTVGVDTASALGGVVIIDVDATTVVVVDTAAGDVATAGAEAIADAPGVAGGDFTEATNSHAVP